MNDKLEALLKRLQRIADENEDQFACRFEVGLRGGIKDRKPTQVLYITFVCEETADGHVFIDGAGWTMEEALDSAIASLPEALKEWGYTE